MALREDLLPVFNAARTLIQDFGLRTSRVWVRRGSWDGGEIHLGSLENEDTEILPRPKVEPVGSHSLKVSRITPDHATGGWTPQELNPPMVAGEDSHFVVRMPDGGTRPYRLVEINQTRNFGYELILQALDRANPDQFD